MRAPSADLNFNLYKPGMIRSGERVRKFSPSKIIGGGARMSMPRVLIVEDETRLLSHLEQTLQVEGFSTFTCATYTELETFLRLPVKRIDVILLDRLLQRRDSRHLLAEM